LYELGKLTEAERQAAFHVYLDSSVSLGDGTGILHVAPRYGETDLALGQARGAAANRERERFGKMVDEFAEVPGLEEIAGQFL
jgi:isoleucyl-tRNA synthetase